MASLPPPFRAATVVWQLTASAGKRLDALYMRLWYWLSRPMTGGELTAWCHPAIEAKWLDPVTCRDVQPIYVAVRIVPEGAPDPCPRRWGIVRGEVGTVAAPVVVPGVAPDHAGRSKHLDVIGGDARALAARYGNSLPGKRVQAVDKIKASIERMRAAADGARHPTWCSEYARVLGVCEFWCVDPERPLELLQEAYLETLAPHEVAKRQRGSIEGVPAWFDGRESAERG